MFWNEYGSCSKTLGGCLDRDNFTLEELLDNDDILQECRSQNKKLVEFLEKDEIIEKLIDLIITEPPATVDPTTSYRYPNLACEIINSGLPTLITKLANNNDCLRKLYSFLDSKPPLNPLLASFFAKTLQTIFTRHCGQDWYTYQVTCLRVVEFSKNPSTLSKFMEHLGTSAIADALNHSMHTMQMDVNQDFIRWLDSQNFIEKLINVMCGHRNNVFQFYENPGFSEDSLNKLEFEDSCVKQESLNDNEIDTEKSEGDLTKENSNCDLNQSNSITPADQNITEANVQSGAVDVNEDSTIKTIVDNVHSDREPIINNDETNIDQNPTLEAVITSKTDDEKPASIEKSLSQETDSANTRTPEEIRVSADMSENAASLLCDIIAKEYDPSETYTNLEILRKKCELPSTVNFLLSSVFNSPIECRQYAVINGIQVLTAILNDNIKSEEISGIEQGTMNLNSIIEVVLQYFPNLKEVLTQTPARFKYGYSNAIETPFGAIRLSVVRLFENLMKVCTQEIATAFVKSEIMPLLLDLFVEYKWNNFLHDSVTNIICKMFEAKQYSELFSMHLFVDCKLLDRFVEIWEKNSISEKCRQPRYGYMGYLIKIGNYIQDYLDAFPSVLDNKLSEESLEKWYNILFVELDQINKVQSFCLGGQHPLNTINSNQHSQPEFHSQGYENLKMQVQELNYEDEDFGDGINNFGGLGRVFERNYCFSDDTTENRNSEIGPNTSKTMDEEALFGLATKLSICKTGLQKFVDDFLPYKTSDWEDSENMLISTNLDSSIAMGNLSPWDANTNLSNDTIEWADFSNCEDAVALSEFQANFSSDSFDNSPMKLVDEDPQSSVNINDISNVQSSFENITGVEKSNINGEIKPISEEAIPQQNIITTYEVSDTSADFLNKFENLSLSDQPNVENSCKSSNEKLTSGDAVDINNLTSSEANSTDTTVVKVEE